MIRSPAADGCRRACGISATDRVGEITAGNLWAMDMSNELRRRMRLCEAMVIPADHGTQQDLHAQGGSVNPARQGTFGTGAIWVAENPQVTGRYAGADLFGNAPDCAQIMPIRLKMQNPLVVDLSVNGPKLRRSAWFDHPEDGRIRDIDPVKDHDRLCNRRPRPVMA
jgi:hypothetical protein